MTILPLAAHAVGTKAQIVAVMVAVVEQRLGRAFVRRPPA